jgi:predicted acyl esterase
VTFTSNPDFPCPTLGGTNNLISCTELGGTCGPYDQREIEARSDVLVFTSLPGTAWIVGRIYADVWIQTDLPDVDVFVRMTDVSPDGNSRLMAQGIQRARYRNGVCPQPLDLTQPKKIRVDLGSTALVLPGNPANHKLRVIVSAAAGASYHSLGLPPLYDINPQNGDEISGLHPNRAGSITVRFGTDYPSALVIPVPTGQTLPPDRRPNTTPCPFCCN